MTLFALPASVVDSQAYGLTRVLVCQARPSDTARLRLTATGGNEGVLRLPPFTQTGIHAQVAQDVVVSKTFSYLCLV